MNSTSEKKRSKLFRSPEFPKEFVQDLETFLSLSPEDRRIISDFYETRRLFLSSFTEDELKELSQRTQEKDERVLKDIGDIIQFFLRQVAVKDVLIEEIENDLGLLGRTSEEIRSVTNFFANILSKQPDYKNRALKIAASNATIDTLDSIGFSTDVRAVYDRSNNLIDFVPILIVRMIIEGTKREEEVLFQVNKEKLEQLMEMFMEQKRRMEEISVRTQLRKE